MVLSLVGLAVPTAATAQDWDRADDPPERTESTLYPPNIVDPHGCVRMCDQDMSPCDPPLYKHADGRCTNDY